MLLNCPLDVLVESDYILGQGEVENIPFCTPL